jgi:hypothetical protein
MYVFGSMFINIFESFFKNKLYKHLYLYILLNCAYSTNGRVSLTRNASIFILGSDYGRAAGTFGKGAEVNIMLVLFNLLAG